jgi:hypothetical protein
MKYPNPFKAEYLLHILPALALRNPLYPHTTRKFRIIFRKGIYYSIHSVRLLVFWEKRSVFLQFRISKYYLDQ